MCSLYFVWLIRYNGTLYLVIKFPLCARGDFVTKPCTRTLQQYPLQWAWLIVLVQTSSRGEKSTVAVDMGVLYFEKYSRALHQDSVKSLLTVIDSSCITPGETSTKLHLNSSIWGVVLLNRTTLTSPTVKLAAQSPITTGYPLSPTNIDQPARWLGGLGV